ncbi:MAG TPA: histidinol dehydrogenase [Clostridiales bacterium]|jgi:histidinol dehydrogenase|nr:histidinol dehydrogenase [Clostridiales bacterium]HOJ35604.1 histidinol dehydrogenase [Clostridiales bacterium]HOL79249.1 histidinol dehydrogenase [Clostridiales bacterium]HPU67778.1 histidinol dehydrogenase [Clostridiales bacterium]HQA04933.1 histidinol dehydrogenase [Clostridiales bacterium]
MIKIAEYDSKAFKRERAQADADVRYIINDVAERGDEALFEYTLRFDGCKPESLLVTQEEIDAAAESVGEYFLDTLKMAAENIRAFHKKQLSDGFSMTAPFGSELGQIVRPIEKAGLYIPGGTASYPSTVLMNAIPAKIAGVSEIVAVTPPDKEGRVNPAVLAAAKVAGIDKIFKVGGAQAIAALACGTESIPKVDKIVGPGNRYVASAKRLVYGLVDIDMIAGPSEILIVADKNADPVNIAADLLSQAEHDTLASAILVTDNKELAEKVQAEVERQLELLPRAEIARQSIDNQSAIFLCSSISEAIEIANDIAPEHLEICVEEPKKYLADIKNAGSIFLGAYTPEALGDYFAGTNHTLPTSGTARFASPLGVDDFIKRSSYIYYTKEALSEVKDRIAHFARFEGLEAHARSVESRFRGEGNG